MGLSALCEVFRIWEVYKDLPSLLIPWGRFRHSLVQLSFFHLDLICIVMVSAIHFPKLIRNIIYSADGIWQIVDITVYPSRS